MVEDYALDVYSYMLSSIFHNRKYKGNASAMPTNRTHSRGNYRLLGLLHDPLDSEGDEVGNEGGDEAHDEACDHVVASMLVVPLDVKKRAKATIRELPT